MPAEKAAGSHRPVASPTRAFPPPFVAAILCQRPPWAPHALAPWQGDTGDYTNLVAQLRRPATFDVLQRIVVALNGCVSALSTSRGALGELVDAIFRFDWVCPEPVAKCYGTLIVNLVSANGLFLPPAFSMLVKAFMPLPPGATPVGASPEAFGGALALAAACL